MRAIDRNLLVFSTASMLFFGIFTVRNMNHIKEEASLHENAEAESIEQVEEKIDPWDLFVEAVIWRESRGDSNAIGDNGKAVGVLQIHPIMVREANRILAMNGKENSYTYDDRYVAVRWEAPRSVDALIQAGLSVNVQNRSGFP